MERKVKQDGTIEVDGYAYGGARGHSGVTVEVQKRPGEETAKAPKDVIVRFQGRTETWPRGSTPVRPFGRRA